MVFISSFVLCGVMTAIDPSARTAFMDKTLSAPYPSLLYVPSQLTPPPNR